MTDNSYKGEELTAQQAHMADNTISYKGKELTARQAFVVGNLTRRQKTIRAHQIDLEQRLEAARGELVMGNKLRRERGLTEDQDTEWEYPCGKIRLQQLSDVIPELQAEIRACASDRLRRSQYIFKLQSYLDSLSLPTAVPASEAPNASDEDVPGFAPASGQTGGPRRGGYPAAPPQQEPRYPRGGDFDGDVFPGGSAGGLMGPDHPAFGSGGMDHLGGRFPGLPGGPGQLPPGVPPGARFDPFGPAVPMPGRGGMMGAPPCATCCPGGEQDTADSSSSDDEDGDD